MNLLDVYPLYDITPTHAEGHWVYGADGTRYLDLYGGHAVISIGHSHPHYVEQLTAQLQRIGFYSNSVHIPLQQELARQLGEQCGYPDYALFLCNSGAEANENALKLASFHTGKPHIIAFSGSFHGRTSLAVEATDHPQMVAPANHSGHVSFLPFNDIEALNNLEGRTDIAAFIVEGIQGVAGVRVPTPAFLQALRQWCDKLGALLVLDEVQSGFGRSGHFFAHQIAGVQADIISVAKGMGNGFPIGAVLSSPAIIPRHGMLGTTFGGNYLACAASLSVLNILNKENLLSHARLSGEYWMDALRKVPGVAEVRGHGLMIGLQLNQPCAPVRKRLLMEHHIFTGTSMEPHTLRLLPALNLPAAQMEVFTQALTQVLATS
ncbi:MAG: aminotransferase class III-fold pyridoxal phosphate-dependent enzyme [Bacteroidetes bacterium]|nr:aminotransferase class III-fold pyridoxal phosphate-dependent enzyme [Bacteroidota bacterium]